MEKPVVSIVTTSYNQERYLEETLHSVFDQDYPRIQYLVIDDGSTDSSPEILRRHSDRIDWLKLQENEGQVQALNRAFAHATGEVLAFINSDDTLLPGAVSRAVAEFERNPGLLLVYGDAIYVDERSERIAVCKARAWDLAEMARTGMQPVPQPASFWSRRAWQLAGPFNPRAWSLFDTEFYLRLATKGPAARLATPLATFRLHPESKSLSRHERMAEECLRFAREFYGEALPTSLRPYARAGRASFYRRAAIDLYTAGQVRRARWLLLRALALSPAGVPRGQVGRLVRTLLPEPLVRRRRRARLPA